MTTRRQSHAGSWYSANRTELDNQLTKWLQDVKQADGPLPACAVIAPHAGFSYSGATAAYAYRHIDPARVKRVFILGPSHHFYLRGCALTKHVAYATPLGDLEVDAEITAALSRTGEFDAMTTEVDEEEHSIEMHLPYIQKIMSSAPHKCTIVPVLVGSLKPKNEDLYGRIFAKYLRDPENFFVISSDFCHWGERFRYTYYNPAHGEIHQSIEQLDKEGMAVIEKLDPTAFVEYQAQYQNTICGRHPIAILLNSINTLVPAKLHFDLRFVRYAQSSKCREESDSSVSYASAVCKCTTASMYNT